MRASNPSQRPVVHQGATLVLGPCGGLGASWSRALDVRGETVVALSRHAHPPFDYRDTASIERRWTPQR